MKTKDIGCEFCNKFDFSTASVEIKEDGAYIVSGLCNTRFPTDEQFNFCPICGKQIRKDKEEKEIKKQPYIASQQH